MYPVSTAYQKAIRQNVRNIKIIGTITLKDSTIINIADEDIVQGSLYVSEQCVSGEDIEVGNVYASEMGLSLSIPLANPYSLDGARILLHFGIDVSNDGSGLWETVPLGYFYVTEIERKARYVNLTALDGMLLFDVPCGEPGPSTPRNLVAYVCAVAGVTLGTSIAEIDTYANATTLLATPDAAKIKTCRDLLMWACQLMGAFARMNRQGQLEIVPIAAGISVKTIGKAERFKSDVSDFYVQISKVSMQVGEVEYSQGTEGMTMALEDNPLMAGMTEEQINTILDNLLAQVTQAVYVPCSINFAGDPAIQAGDYITLRDAGILDTETDTYFFAETMPFEANTNIVTSIVTHSTWRYRGPHNVKGVGKSGLVRGVQNQQVKAVSSIVALARAAQNIALAANQSTQLIKDAIGGHVLIRQNLNETNEILIMDHPDPAQATKIWRWNMGGLGYSDNVTGADNPAREYETAMTMDGAINATFVRTGMLGAGVVQIGSATTYEEGYDPSEKETPAGAQVKAEATLNAFIASTYADDLAAIQAQLDGVIDTWFYEGAPTLLNDPAVDWTTEDLKNNHLGDLYYDLVTGYAYRFVLDDATYQWRQIPDTDVATALAMAATAQDTADHKRRVFVDTPTPPYDVGDLWTEGPTGHLRKCTAAKTAAQAYDPADWELATKYTDDSAANAYAEQKAAEAQAAAEEVAQAEAALAQANAEAYADGLVTAEEQARIDQAEANLAEAKAYAETKASEAQAAAEAAANSSLESFVETVYNPNVAGLQDQIDGKIETWYQATAPTWPVEDRMKHNGDVWYQRPGGIQRRYNGVLDKWEVMEDQQAADAFAAAARANDTADNKRRVFITQPYPPYDEGDLWTQGPTGELMRCITPKADTYETFLMPEFPIGGEKAEFSLDDWELASKYTDDTAVEEHNNQTSPHNLPTFVQLTDDGIIVYDTSSGSPVQRVKLGEYDNGEFGVDINKGKILIESTSGKNRIILNPDDAFKIQKLVDGAWADVLKEDIDGDLIMSGKIIRGSGSSIFKADDYGIYLGNEVFADAPFSVSLAGELKAYDADIQGIIDCSDLKINGVSILDTVYQIKGECLADDSVGADKLKLEELEVGTNIAMGPSATISWNQVTNQPSIPVVPSYITSTKITQTTIESPTITGGTVTGATVQTAVSGTRVVLSANLADIDFYHGSNHLMKIADGVDHIHMYPVVGLSLRIGAPGKNIVAVGNWDFTGASISGGIPYVFG